MQNQAVSRFVPVDVNPGQYCYPQNHAIHTRYLGGLFLNYCTPVKWENNAAYPTTVKDYSVMNDNDEYIYHMLSELNSEQMSLYISPLKVKGSDEYEDLPVWELEPPYFQNIYKTKNFLLLSILDEKERKILAWVDGEKRTVRLCEDKDIYTAKNHAGNGYDLRLQPIRIVSEPELQLDCYALLRKFDTKKDADMRMREYKASHGKFMDPYNRHPSYVKSEVNFCDNEKSRALAAANKILKSVKDEDLNCYNIEEISYHEAHLHRAIHEADYLMERFEESKQKMNHPL